MMNDTTVNGRDIKVGYELQMVNVLTRSADFGHIVPSNARSFNSPQDGSMQECYDKALAWAKEN